MAKGGELRYFLQVVTAVFIGRYNLADRLAKANILHQAVKDVFNGDPVLFPIPDEAPPEIPRIILASKDHKYLSTVAANRAEVIYNEQGTPNKDPLSIRDDYLKLINQFAKVFKLEWNDEILRLGLLMNLVSFVENPVQLIMKSYIREGSMANPQQLEVHSLVRIQLDDLGVNRWCRLSSLEMPGPTGVRQALRVVLDLNTPSEEGRAFTYDAIIGFYDRASRYALSNLNLLFPGRSEV